MRTLMIIPGAFGRRLRQLREGRGLSIRALASAAGVSHPMLVRVESGEREPSYAIACALADALTVSLDSFRT